MIAELSSDKAFEDFLRRVSQTPLKVQLERGAVTVAVLEAADREVIGDPK